MITEYYNVNYEYQTWVCGNLVNTMCYNFVDYSYTIINRVESFMNIIYFGMQYVPPTLDNHSSTSTNKVAS